MPLLYLTWSLIYGAKAPANPWDATGLEWQTPSPPPKQNFLRPPRVTTDPYEYHDFGRAEESGSEARAQPQGEPS
jgi:cytochrome c oxidase subunit I